MHNVFRTFAQQTGVQLIRGILPKNIDDYINDAISEKVQIELNNGVQNDLQANANLQASVMSSVNTFRTLFRNARFSININDTNADGNGKVSYYEPTNGFYILNIPVVNSDIIVSKREYRINPMMFLGFSVEYGDTLRGNSIPCRIVGEDMIDITNGDYCNKASKGYPIVVLNSKPSIQHEIEVDNNSPQYQLSLYTNTEGAEISFLNIKYIKAPNVVKYDEDPSLRVNCDLPDYTHFDIVKRAVEKFHASMGVANSARLE